MGSISSAGKDAQLRDLLGAEPPASVLALDEPVRRDLVAVIREARARQAAELAASYDASMKHVPAPIRAVVKRVLRG
jgi:hypothetical protein